MCAPTTDPVTLEVHDSTLGQDNNYEEADNG